MSSPNNSRITIAVACVFLFILALSVVAWNRSGESIRSFWEWSNSGVGGTLTLLRGGGPIIISDKPLKKGKYLFRTDPNRNAEMDYYIYPDEEGFNSRIGVVVELIIRGK